MEYKVLHTQQKGVEIKVNPSNTFQSPLRHPPKNLEQ